MKEREKLTFEIEELEEKIAPSALGTLGFEGNPGNQSAGGTHNPVPNGSTPEPN